MKKIKFRRFEILKLSCGLLFVLTSGCVNPYKNNYLSTLQKWPGAVSDSILKPAGPPRLLTSANMKKDAQAMLETGFVLMGRAKFRNEQLDENLALQQAQAIGAWVVLVSDKYVGTETQSVPIADWTPDQTTTTTEDVQVQRDPNKPPVDIQRQVTQTTPGQLQISYVPENVDYYDYSATFWGKTKPSLMGVLVQPLSADLKQTYQTNKGVVVKIVIQKSPAYNANVLEGDVLMSLAGEDIETPDQFFDILSRHAGQSVALNLFRNGQAQTIQLTLNQAP